MLFVGKPKLEYVMSTLENNPKKQDQSEQKNLNSANFAAKAETSNAKSNEGGDKGNPQTGDLTGASFGRESALVQRAYMEAQRTSENHQMIEEKMAVGNFPDSNQSQQKSGENG
jgi:hypothetical protein